MVDGSSVKVNAPLVHYGLLAPSSGVILVARQALDETVHFLNWTGTVVFASCRHHVMILLLLFFKCLKKEVLTLPLKGSFG